VGQVQGEPRVFIDEILPNGMIDMHGKFVRKMFEINYLRNTLFIGTLKEGDYLIQAGVYSLIDIDVTIALELIERAYNEGRKVHMSETLIVSLIYI
jgi:hypothetical protein